MNIFRLEREMQAALQAAIGIQVVPRSDPRPAIPMCALAKVAMLTNKAVEVPKNPEPLKRLLMQERRANKLLDRLLSINGHSRASLGLETPPTTANPGQIGLATTTHEATLPTPDTIPNAG